MLKKKLSLVVAWLISLASGTWMFQDGCAAVGGDDCIGPDGYNWCVAGGGWGEIHEPSVSSWDFSDSYWE